MFWVQLFTSAVKFLCISIPQTLLDVTLKRRAEISAVIFAHLLRYVRLSYKNLTIKEKKIAIESRISVTDSKVQNTDLEIFA